MWWRKKGNENGPPGISPEGSEPWRFFQGEKASFACGATLFPWRLLLFSVGEIPGVKSFYLWHSRISSWEIFAGKGDSWGNFIRKMRLFPCGATVLPWGISFCGKKTLHAAQRGAKIKNPNRQGEREKRRSERRAARDFQRDGTCQEAREQLQEKGRDGRRFQHLPPPWGTSSANKCFASLAPR